MNREYIESLIEQTKLRLSATRVSYFKEILSLLEKVYVQYELETIEDVLDGFKKLGYCVLVHNDDLLKLVKFDKIIVFEKNNQRYICYWATNNEPALYIRYDEYKLINRIIELWGWNNGTRNI